MNRKKIGIVHPKLGRGGSEQRALWALSALKDEYQVSLITIGEVDVPSLNDYYGTNLDPRSFSVLRPPFSFGLQRLKGLAALRGAILQRYCQRLSSGFDLMISTYNPVNFEAKAIQFIADFSFDKEIREDLDLTSQDWGKWYREEGAFRNLYLWFCNLVSSNDPEGWRDDVVVANSHWTAELMRKIYGVDTPVIYPPVIGGFPEVSWEKREKGFVWLGRIVPEKKVDLVIKILKKVRQKGQDIHLHVCGGINNDGYGRAFKQLLHKNKDWISWEGWVGETRKKEIIGDHRFGISGRRDEPFGISMAEEVKGGCIVFVPDSGGQTEIVDHPALTYKDLDDAVDKIGRVLSSPGLQEELRMHLSKQKDKFSVENFKQEVTNIVSDFFAGEYD